MPDAPHTQMKQGEVDEQLVKLSVRRYHFSFVEGVSRVGALLG